MRRRDQNVMFECEESEGIGSFCKSARNLFRPFARDSRCWKLRPRGKSSYYYFSCAERTISNDVGLVRVDDLPAFSIIRDSLSRF